MSWDLFPILSGNIQVAVGNISNGENEVAGFLLEDDEQFNNLCL